MSPLLANYHYDPGMQYMAPKQTSNLNSEIPADTIAAGLEETHQTLRMNMQVQWHGCTRCVQGWVTPIVYSQLATSLTSALRILPLNPAYTITQIHMCNRDPSLTIQILTRPDAGVHAFTLFSIFSHWMRFAHEISRFNP